MTDFKKRVHEVVKNIPKGSVMSYREVATASGNSKAARAVASIMAANFDSSIPCHRVIKSDGTIGGYNRGGTTVKRSILRSEGYNL